MTSIPVVGSSNITTGGDPNNARATERRRFCPPLKVLINSSALPNMSTPPKHSSTNPMSPLAAPALIDVSNPRMAPNKMTCSLALNSSYKTSC